MFCLFAPKALDQGANVALRQLPPAIRSGTEAASWFTSSGERAAFRFETTKPI